MRYVSARLRDDGAVIAAAAGFAQLAGELAGDTTGELPAVVRERHAAAAALSELVTKLDDSQLESVRGVAQPVLDRAALDPAQNAAVAAGLVRLRGGLTANRTEDDTSSGRMRDARAGALSLRDGAARARAADKLPDAFAALEAANHVSPGDPDLLRELIDLAGELADHDAAARYLLALAQLQRLAAAAAIRCKSSPMSTTTSSTIRRARAAMRDAAEALTGSRRDATLRLLASEAASHLAWDVAVEASSAIVPERRSPADLVALATAFVRSGKNAAAVSLIDAASASGEIDDGGAMLAELHAEVARKAQLARTYEWRARGAPEAESAALRADAAALLSAISRGFDPAADTERDLVRRMRAEDERSQTEAEADFDDATTPHGPSVRISGTPAENLGAMFAAAAAADRDRLLAAYRKTPNDPAVLLALLAHLGDREPDLRRAVLDRAANEGSGRTQSLALHELALVARNEARDPIRASALWSKANRVDPSFAPVWMPFADALAGADELDHARDLYEQIASSADYDQQHRSWAADRAEALGRDDSIVSGEIVSRSERVTAVPPPSDRRPARPTVPAAAGQLELVEARALAEQEQWPAAIASAERAATAAPASVEPLELLEQLYAETGDVTAASEAIGRQLVLAEEATTRAILWRRRAKLYRDALGRDAEVYRCLKEAHACAPADPEIAYQLRTAAMVRGEWALVASLLYREIAVAAAPARPRRLAPRARADLRGEARRSGAGPGQLRTSARVRPDDPGGSRTARAPLRGDRPPRRGSGAVRDRRDRRARHRSGGVARGRRAMSNAARTSEPRVRARGPARGRRGGWRHRRRALARASAVARRAGR